ncbi:hypothetical protein D3C74_59050 [compost metagenome]
MKSLFELVNEVTDEASFLHFLQELGQDKAEGHEWANESVEAFLEAAQEWGNASMHGLEHYEKPENPWKRCAQMLYMGKIYE